MNKIKACITLGVILITFLHPAFSQGKVYKVGIFAPLYLDSAFNSNNVLKYDRALPKQSIAGLEFIEGALIALDSLSANKPVEAFIYDVKSATDPLASLVKNKTFDNLDLIIGSVKDVDFKMLSDISLQKNIPFISATYPNDGGVTGNPFLVILNSTLKAHCEGIFNYILQQHGTERVLLVKRKGDDRIFNYFKNLNAQEGKPLIKIETMSVDSFVYTSSLKNHLDSNFKTVIIGASLDEGFAKSLANAAFGIKAHYPLTLIGMPNWEGFRSFSGKDNYKDFPILYTTPYFIQKGLFDMYLSKEYFRLYKSRPTDMVYKGYEATYFFTHLLLNHPSDLTSQLNDKSLSVFHDFNFKPVYIIKKNGLPDYFENTHLFIMKLLNGVTSREW